MPRKRTRRHPPQSPLEQFFSGLRDTVLDFVEDAAYDLEEAFYRQQGKQQQPPQPRATPKADKRPRTRPVTKPAPTLYQVLGVATDAPKEVIQAAYKALARLHHPDLPNGNAEKMKRVNAAFDVLSDPGKRREYDRKLRSGL